MEHILMDYIEFIPQIQNYIKKKKKKTPDRARIQCKKRKEFLFLKRSETFQISFTSS